MTTSRRRVQIVGVDTAKETVYARWQIDCLGPGYCRIPADPDLGYTDEWCKQATSEVIQTRYSKGREVTSWVLPSGRRNEALDCRVYATAAVKSVASRLKVEPASPRPRPRPQNDWLGDTNEWL